MKDNSEGINEKIDLGAHYNATQLRYETWNRLKDLSRKLHELQRSKSSTRSLEQMVAKIFDILAPIESYGAFPGKEVLQHLENLFERREYRLLSASVTKLVRMLVSDAYRTKADAIRFLKLSNLGTGIYLSRMDEDTKSSNKQHYFEVLVVDDLASAEENELRQRLTGVASSEEKFIYDIVVARSFKDALVAVVFNYNIQCCVIRYNFPFKSKYSLDILQPFLSNVERHALGSRRNKNLGPVLGETIKRLRPELDLYLVTDIAVEEIPHEVYQNFRRVFYRQEDYHELHLSLLRGIRERYETPFFDALREYSQRPTGVFHAMPISRGNSVFKSHWIQDMSRFYGRNIFLAETSATTGGLDSLLQPRGPLKKAQELAAHAFGAEQTFFVTNGTSTANKIVLQALVQPNDIVLVDRDCHKSHHYGMVLSGAHPVYLDSYPIEEYSMYGAVPLKEIKRKLLELKSAGKLDRVKMLLLTNCTFDGFVYNVERVMEEVLAIKPDMIFLWDEAWFGFAYFTPTYRRRTAMRNASHLSKRYRSEAYRAEYEVYKQKMEDLDWDNEATWLEQRLLPDPDKVKIRVYATQSTHKKLSSLRQAAMIHIHDEEFSRRAEDTFHEAYMTHTSTSPNYQILASLDLARRQVSFEGFEMVQKSIEMAMTLRAKIAYHPLLQRYFRVLTIKDLIPQEYRPSGVERYYDVEQGWSKLEDAWELDDFVLDPTHITLFVGKTGIDGDTFKNRHLMDKFGIQINKTSRNTVLFMTNIGTRRSSVTFLIGALLQIAEELEKEERAYSAEERSLNQRRIEALTQDLPPLPDFSYFHPRFRPDRDSPEGDIRSAYFLAYNDEKCEYLSLDGSIKAEMESGRKVVAASFIIPYPPGFPILVPGQVISHEILDFMRALDVKEIHGYRPELGLRVFREEVLAAADLRDGAATANLQLESENGKQDPESKKSKRVKKKGKAKAEHKN